MTVSVASDETLDVTYEFTLYPQNSDIVGTLNLSSGTHSTIVRPCEAGRSSFLTLLGYPYLTLSNPSNGLFSPRAPVPFTDSFSPVGGETAPVEYIRSGVDEQGHYIEMRVKAPLSRANFSEGIRSMKLAPSQFVPVQIGFEPPIPKTASQTFSITLRTYFGRRE